MSEDGSPCRVRYYRESDDEALISLLQESYGGWPTVDVTVAPIEHLRWKLNSHAIAPRYHMVAEIDSRIVGVRQFWAQPVKVRDRVLMLRQAVDGCVQPAYQGRGIAAQLRAFGAEEFRRAFDLHIGGQSGHPAMIKLWLRESQQPLGNEIEAWERSLRRVTAPPERPAVQWTVSQVSRFDGRIDRFWEDASRAFDFLVVRSKDYLNWRYADPRAGAFTIKLAEEGERVLGYAVLRVLRGKGYLADLLVLPDRLDVLDSLVCDAIRTFGEAGVGTVRYWTPARHPYKAMIAEHGFVFKRRRKRYITFLALGTSWDELAFLEDPQTRVHFTIGDLDIV